MKMDKNWWSKWLTSRSTSSRVNANGKRQNLRQAHVMWLFGVRGKKNTSILRSLMFSASWSVAWIELFQQMQETWFLHGAYRHCIFSNTECYCFGQRLPIVAISIILRWFCKRCSNWRRFNWRRCWIITNVRQFTSALWILWLDNSILLRVMLI